MKRLLLSFLSLLPGISLLSACNSSSEDSASKKPIPSQAQIDASQTLSILPLKCVGCGKCVRIDPAHFAWEGSSRKVAVISQENISSSLVQKAIVSCPRGAIQG